MGFFVVSAPQNNIDFIMTQARGRDDKHPNNSYIFSEML